MAYKFTSSSEALPVRSLVATLFGQPGVGKTSLGNTVENPVLLDFDEGVERAIGRKTTVRFEKWSDAIDFINSPDFVDNEFKTIVVDTAGTMLDDYMAQHIIAENPKLRATSGGLTLQGYGALKSLFSTFLSTLRSKNVDLIMIAHAQEKEDGDNMRLRPKMTGGAYDMLLAKSDLVGYMEMRGNEITLDFNPTDRHVGKNCAEFNMITVPHYEDKTYQTFFGDLLTQTKERMQKETKEQAEAVKIVKKYTKKLDACKDMPELGEVGEEIEQLETVYRVQVQKEYDKRYVELWGEQFISPAEKGEDLDKLAEQAGKLDKQYIKPVKLLIKAKADELGFKYNTTSKKFENTEPPREYDGDAEKKQTTEEKAPEETEETPKVEA